MVLQGRVGRYQTLLHAVPDPEMNRGAGAGDRPRQPALPADHDPGCRAASNHVKPGQAVVDARGMIGRIYLAGERTSWVILLTDLNSRIPVTIAPGNRPGDHDRRQHRHARAGHGVPHRHPACGRPGDQSPAMAACCRRACPSARWWQTAAAGASRCWPMPPPARMSRS